MQTARLLLLSTLLAVACLLTLRAAPAWAGAVLLKGTISKNCYLQVEDLNAQLNLVGGASSVTVANVGETCNSKEGYTVTLSSQFSGALSSDFARAPYTVSYDDVTNASLSSPIVLDRGGQQKKEVVRPLKVTLPANARAVAGNYFDSLIITIAAK